MSIISIVIPSRNEKYLSKTILDILNKAETDVEVIAILDGYWEKSEDTIVDKRVKYIHNGKPTGMRDCVNKGVKIASGKYLLKCDAHVMFAKGFDKVLIENHKNGRIQVPTRKRLDPEKWELIDTKKPDINYLTLDKNYRGVLNNKMNKDPGLAKRKIDRIEAFQGSCWFMKTTNYKNLGLLDSENWGPMGHESQEIYFKSKMRNGHVVRNKLTWYAHWHKNKEDLNFNVKRDKSREYIKVFLKEYYFKDKNRVKKDFRRRHLAKMFRGVGAEIGVRSGAFSETICKFGQPTELYSIDPYATPYRDKRSRLLGIEKQESFYQEAVQRLGAYKCCKILRKESMVAVADFDYESLDFVYIDGSHAFDYVMCDIIEWAKRVKPGGIVSGHDYYKFRDAEVVTAVDSYCKIHKYKIQLTDERTPSWWFVKR